MSKFWQFTRAGNASLALLWSSITPINGIFSKGDPSAVHLRSTLRRPYELYATRTRNRVTLEQAVYGERRLCTRVGVTVWLPAHLLLRKVSALFRYSLNIGRAQEAECFDLEILIGLAL